MLCFYLSHPQIVIDPHTPVPQWHLSDKGRARLDALVGKGWIAGLRRIVSSDETKAIETAIAIGTLTGLPHDVLPDLHENDRSSTGFIEPDAFEAAADAFFASPETSYRGWERAADAQSRIVAAVTAIARAGEGPVLFCGHGGVGTLLKCHLKGAAISRNEDQPGGGGNVYAFDPLAPRCLGDWTPLETFEWPAT